MRMMLMMMLMTTWLLATVGRDDHNFSRTLAHGTTTAESMVDEDDALTAQNSLCRCVP
jgi:hypothetical protein